MVNQHGRGAAPLPRPSRWEPVGVKQELEVVADGLTLRYRDSRTSGDTADAAAVRADHVRAHSVPHPFFVLGRVAHVLKRVWGRCLRRQPVPSDCGVYYWEVEVLSKGRDGYIGIGLSASTVNLGRLPGWEQCVPPGPTPIPVSAG
jgi:hypothetical protein